MTALSPVIALAANRPRARLQSQRQAQLHLKKQAKKEAEVSALSKVHLYRLFQLAQRLLVLEPQTAAGDALLEAFLGVFGITAVCLYTSETDGFSRAGDSGGELDGPTRATYTAGQDQDDTATGLTIRRLITDGRTTGAIAFQGLENPRVTAGPLVALAAALQEGMRFRRKAALAPESDMFRSAIFDVLGSECKNALTTILAATGGLREAGPLRAEQLEMARMVEEEASRLGGLISRLDWIARLDQGEVSPRMDTTNLRSLVAQAVDQWSRVSPDRHIAFACPDVEFAALADPELLRLALGQLLDNACKFSVPGATVHVEIEARDGVVVVMVASEGNPIPPQEQGRIFERSYLGAQSSSFAAGSGLGLYAARKIAAAHGGTLDLDPEKMLTSCIAFRLSLPRAGAPSDE
jgi:two-component system sensor histidine kinase KdpD